MKLKLKFERNINSFSLFRLIPMTHFKIKKTVKNPKSMCKDIKSRYRFFIGFYFVPSNLAIPCTFWYYISFRKLMRYHLLCELDDEHFKRWHWCSGDHKRETFDDSLGSYFDYLNFKLNCIDLLTCRNLPKKIKMADFFLQNNNCLDFLARAFSR